MEMEEYKLAQKLLQTYNTMVRPAKNHRDTTHVTLSLELVNLIDMVSFSYNIRCKDIYKAQQCKKPLSA